ncbi:MAG: serine/threonine-protein kinase PknK [Bradymonadia bacterium]
MTRNSSDSASIKRSSAAHSVSTETLTPSIDSAEASDEHRQASVRLQPGTRLGDFEVKQEIGHGGGGRVYLALDTVLERQVALKLLRRDLIDITRVQVFLNEARTTARFHHPHVVMVHSAQLYQNTPYLVLEYLDGGSLRDRLRDGPLPVAEAMSIGLAIASVLGAAHERGILHCDLKPENIVFSGDGVAKVVDFGLTAAIGDPVRRRLVGTPAYMSPEQWRQESLMPASDVWALSVLLYEMFAGHRPYERADLIPLPPVDPHPDIPPALMDLIEEGLSVEISHRPDARVFEATLDGLLAERHLQSVLQEKGQILGRGPEQAKLRRAVERMTLGVGSVTVIEGNAGLGKSLLLTDFVAWAQGRGHRVLTGVAEVLSQGTPYLPWRRVISSLLCDTHMPTVEELKQGLQSRAPQGLQHQLALFNAVIPLGLDEGPDLGAKRASTQGEITHRFLVDLLDALCPEPVIIVLDDCHWMDSSSWRLIRHVAEQLPHLMLVLFTRPMLPAPEEMEALKRLEHMEIISLPPLSPEIIRQLVATRMGNGPGADLVADRVVERADGNPLFAEALIDVVHPSRNLSEDPHTVSQAIRTHIRGLPPVAERVLKQASVIGHRFSRLFLAAVYHTPGELAPGLEALIKNRLLVPTSGDELAFYHAITREAAYALLGPQERAMAHRAVGLKLEMEPEQRWAQLAHHWDQAGDEARALKYADAAGQRALKEGAWAEAQRFFTRALELMPDGTHYAAQRAECHERLCAAAYGLGDLPTVELHARQILDRPEPEGPVSRVLSVLVKGAQLYWRLRHPARQMPAQAATTRKQLARTRAWSHLGGVYWFNNRGLPTLHALIRALETAEPLGGSKEQAAACAELGAGLSFSGFHRIGPWLLKRGRQQAAAYGGPLSVAYGHMFEGIYRTGLGEWPDAQAHIERAQSIYEPVGDLYGWCNCQVVRFWCHLYQGEFKQAETAIKALLKGARRTGNRQHEMWALRSTAITKLRRGDSAEALADLEVALGLMESPHRAERVPTLGALALAHMMQGERPQALEHARAAIAAAQGRRPTSHALLEGCAAVVQVTLVARAEGWSGTGLDTLTSRAHALMKSYARAFPIGRSRWCLLQGAHAHQSGRPRKAERHWRRGHRFALQMGMQQEAKWLKACISGQPPEMRHLTLITPP